jgi:DNA-binding transcriptional ArsR family regulator
MAARAATRTPAPNAAQREPGAARPPVRDFAGGGPFVVEWDVRPVFDFMFSLSPDAGSTDDLPGDDRRWLAEARASLPEDVRADLKILSETEMTIHVASYAVERPDLRSVDALVAALKALSPADLVVAMLGDFDLGADTETQVRAAMAGDETALDAVIVAAGDHAKGLRAILADPLETHRRILSVLEAWAVPFKAIEGRVSSIGQRDYEARSGDRATLDKLDLIEQTTGGVRWLPTSGIRRVILAPSYFSRPYNFLLGGEGWRFFGYPVADDALDIADPLEPPRSVVRLHRALGDPTRMRILKLLAGRDLYATEIAQQLELSKPTIKHHLALLRAARLVTITESGAVVYYSLRRNRLDDASSELKRFLGA